MGWELVGSRVKVVGKVSQGHLEGFSGREQPFWGGPEGTILGEALERGHLMQHMGVAPEGGQGGKNLGWELVPTAQGHLGINKCPGEGIRRGQKACRGKWHSKEKLLAQMGGPWLAVRM